MEALLVCARGSIISWISKHPADQIEHGFMVQYREVSVEDPFRYSSR
jgi:hypothetical protein